MADCGNTGVLLSRYSRPTLELDRRGRLVQVNFNNQVRSCQLPCQGEVLGALLPRWGRGTG